MARSLPLFRLLLRSGLARYLPGFRKWSDGAGDFLRYYSDRVLTAPREDLADAAALFDTPPPDIIDLSSAQPRIETASLTMPRQHERRGWPPPWGLPQLRSTIAEKLAQQELVVSPTDEVLITSGAAGALHTILDAFINRGDPVVLFDPTSPLFLLSLRTRRVRVRWLFSWVEEGRTRFKLSELDRVLRGARLLVLTSPGNPSGGLFAPEDLDQIAWWANRHDVLILSDESFAAFLYEGERIAVGTLAHARKRTLTVGSVSKSHGLAALRVGWLAGHRHLVRPCQLSAALRMTMVPGPCQQLALAALRQPVEEGPVISELAARRRYAYERLQAMGLKPAWPVGGLFFWVPVWELGCDGRAFAHRLLNEQRVQVTPGDLFGPSGMGYVRISFAAEDGRLREGLGRLASFLGVARAAAEKTAA